MWGYPQEVGIDRVWGRAGFPPKGHSTLLDEQHKAKYRGLSTPQRVAPLRAGWRGWWQRG